MLFLIMTSLIWGLSFGLIKTQLTSYDPYLVAFLRLGLALMVFLPFLRKTRWLVAFRLMALGAIQFGLMYCLYIYSYAFLSAAQVALLTITTPLFVVGWDGLINQRIPKAFWLAGSLAVLAAAVLVWRESAWQKGMQGVLYLQGANALFALGQVLYKKNAPPGPAHRHFGYLYLGAMLVPLLFLLIKGNMPQIPHQASTWLALIYLGLIASGLGFFWWNQGIRKVNNGMVAVMNNLKIPLGALLAWFIFGEHLDLGRWFAGAALFGLAFLSLRKHLHSHR